MEKNLLLKLLEGRFNSNPLRNSNYVGEVCVGAQAGGCCQLCWEARVSWVSLWSRSAGWRGWGSPHCTASAPPPHARMSVQTAGSQRWRAETGPLPPPNYTSNTLQQCREGGMVTDLSRVKDGLEVVTGCSGHVSGVGVEWRVAGQPTSDPPRARLSCLYPHITGPVGWLV